ncbi:MAG: ATP-dependent DNA helicase [Candidatus Methanoperedens sp.]|nr:ATP-dependent DNA helicase [Candidatus Methanoperedens sp.]
MVYIPLTSLLSTLKSRQLEAIKHTQAPQLILAGAGTGKTTTITAKIAYMVEKENIDPSRILALTFSKEAARNMREKVEKLLQGKEVIVKTFHSFCAELIKDHADRCKVPGDFKIFEEMDSAIFIFRELKTDARTASLYANTIGKAKDLNISIDKFKEFLDILKKQVQNIEKDESTWKELYRESKFKLNTFHLQEFKDKEDKKAKQAEKKRYSEFIDLYEEYQKYSNFISAWEKYEEKKSGIGALDYGDLNKIALWYLDVYGTRGLNDTFRYIIIDEFQDTNYVQFELIKKLTAANKNITVVADPNQTIYAFRGAYTNNIEEFKTQFSLSDKDIVSLDVSFRSTNKILRVAHALIEKNYGAEKKQECLLLKNHRDIEGENVSIIETEDDNEEARAIVEKIEEYLAQGIPPKDIAILYRTHAQGRKVRHALENRGLPFRVKDDTDFLKQPEIKTTLAYLYIINNISHPTARGTEAWWRIFHYNNALSQEDSIRIGEYLKKKWVTFQEAIYHHIEELRLSRSGLETINNVKKRIDSLCSKKNLDVSDLILEVYDLSGLSRQFTHTDTKHSREALLNLRQLHELASNFEEFHGKDLSLFIDYLEILDEMDGNPAPARIADEDAINLMTIHSAKGLEFRVVFVTNLAKDKFPLYRGGAEPLIPPELMEQYMDIFKDESIKDTEKAVRERKKEIKKEEERRLAYVALTRAKEHLFLTLAIKYAEDEREPSEFLQDIGYNNWRGGGNITVGDLSYFRDTDTKVREMVKDNALEREKAVRKRLLIESLDSGDFTECMKNMLLYQTLKVGTTPDFKEVFNSNWEKINPALDAENILGKIKDNKNGLKFNPATMTFSYSSISSYEQCPRQYELAELLRMPTRDSEDSTGAMRRGNFVHKVLEKAVSEKIISKNRLYEIRDNIAKEPEFKGVDIEAATGALEVFWERNKDTIANNLMVEQRFTVPLGGLDFKGFIDRVDLIPGTKDEVEIIDYKAGKYEPGPVERSRQLLLYARGIEHVYPKYKVKRLTLELLARPNPRTFELTCGKYECAGSSRMEGLDENAIEDMIEIAKSIAHDYEHGFERTKDEKACEECGYRLYCGD